jgi:hypothetical protein
MIDKTLAFYAPSAPSYQSACLECIDRSENASPSLGESCDGENAELVNILRLEPVVNHFWLVLRNCSYIEWACGTFYSGISGKI